MTSMTGGLEMLKMGGGQADSLPVAEKGDTSTADFLQK